MIKKFVNRFMDNKSELQKIFEKKHPDDYIDIVRAVMQVIQGDDDEYDYPDPGKIHQIDDGHYQGNLVFVIACGGSQPFLYWYVRVNYGSCSGCDTLQSIRECKDEKPDKEQVEDYMTLALHIVQKLKKMSDDRV